MDDLLAGMSVFAVAWVAVAIAAGSDAGKCHSAAIKSGYPSWRRGKHSLRQRTLRLPERNFSGFYVRVARYLSWIAIEKARR